MSSMSAIQKFFDYLTQNNKSIDEVKNEADTNGDGALKKAELKKWFKENPEIGVTDSEVSQIFNMFNTSKGKGKIDGTKVKNKNGLDDDEMSSMAEKLAAYQLIKAGLDTIFNGGEYEGVSIPQELQQYVMTARGSVEQSIMARINKNMEIPNLVALLTTAIAKTGANGCAQALFNQCLSTYADQLPSGYKGDDDFQRLLSTYINTLNENTDLGSIYSDVQDMVEGYFASAGFGSGDSSVWDETTRGLSELQLQRIKTKLLNDLGSNLDVFSNYKTQVDAAISGYINSLNVASNGFDSIYNNLSAADFMNTQYYKALTVLTQFADFSVSSDENSLYHKLEEVFGETFATRLAEADVTYQNGELYNDILNQVFNMVLNGQLSVPTDENGNLDWSAVINKITELVGDNYNQFTADLGMGSSSRSPEEQITTLNQMFDSGSTSLAALRTASITYLDSLTALNNEQLNAFINSRFENNYTEWINTNRVASELRARINAVADKYTELVNNHSIVEPIDPANCTAIWDDTVFDQLGTLPPTRSIFSSSVSDILNNMRSRVQASVPQLYAGGNEVSFQLHARVMNGDNEVQESVDNQITYGLVSCTGTSGATVSIDPNGTVHVTPGSQAGTVTIRAKVMLNGVQIGTKDITIEVKKAPSIEDAAFDSNDSSEHLEVWNTAGTTDNTQVTDYNFIDLYNNNACICLHREMDTYHSGDGFDGSWSANASIVKQRLGELGTYVVHALSNAGYDGSILERAKTNVVNRWATQSMVDRHVNDRGTDSTALCTNAASYLNDKGEYQGIVNGVDTDGNDSNVYMVSFKAFVDAILEEYNRLI